MTQIRSLILAAALAASFVLPAAAKGPNQTLTPQEAAGWVGKPVFSNDGKEIGKVKLLESSADNKATQIRAEIASYLGKGPHQVILPATRFSLEEGRVVLDMTAEQAAKLPAMNY